MKTKLKYAVSVYLIKDKEKTYRLKYWHKETRTYLTEFNHSFKADNDEMAKVVQQKEQAQDKWLNFQVGEKIIVGDFLGFTRKLISSKENIETRDSYGLALKRLEMFLKKVQKKTEPLLFKDVKSVVDPFREYLLSEVSINTAFWMFSVFAHSIKEAQKAGHITEVIHIKRVKAEKKLRDYLTEEDLQLLVQLPNRNRLQDAFLFECFTAVSFNDLIKLKWSQVSRKTIIVDRQNEVVTKLTYVRGKTEKKNPLPINIILDESILSLMGEPKQSGDYIFPELLIKYGKNWNLACYNAAIKAMVKAAGIEKKITSHRGRATAIIRVIESEGIYAGMKQAGHLDITSTNTYAQYTDSMQFKASKATTRGINFTQLRKVS